MRTKRGKIRGNSYLRRVADINRIYSEHARDGLSNREILRRFIHPVYPISESTFYNILNAEYKVERYADGDAQMSLFQEEDKR